MNRHAGYVRTLTASALIAVAVALAGCQTDELAQIPGRAMQPLPRDLQALIEKKNMNVDAPILVRIYKEDSELEVWKQDASGKFAHLKTYPICRWSGGLGPKVRQGDRQAPEGFYTITPGQMNPNSNYYLAFNLGFPNAYDRAHGYSGAFLMVHGDCSSSGCYSMSDDQMAEIYALGREAFLGGQKSFQVQALPFRLTAANLARHRNSPHMAFWRMLKDGTDGFEVSRQEPRVDVCSGRYVFNQTEAGGGCTGRVPEAIATAVKAKQDEDDREYTALVNQGTPTVPASPDSDGGMHPAFVAKLEPQTIIDTTGRPAAYTKPGTGLPKLVRLPRALDTDLTSSITGRARLTQVASADSSQPVSAPQQSESSSSSGFFSRWFASNQQAAAPVIQTTTKDSDRPSAAAAAKPKSQAKPATASSSASKVAKVEPPKADTPKARDAAKHKPAETKSAAKPANGGGSSSTPASATASAFASASQPAGSQLLPGAQPMVSSGFESRFGGGWR